MKAKRKNAWRPTKSGATSKPSVHIRKGVEWPVFASMKAASGSSELPLGLFKTVKAAGSQAFRSNRVYFGEFLADYSRRLDGGGAGENGGSEKDWTAELKKCQAQREKIRLAADQGKMIDAEEARVQIGEIISIMFSEFERAFTSELPPDLQGLEARAIAARCRKTIWEVRDKIDSVLKEKSDAQKKP